MPTPHERVKVVRLVKPEIEDTGCSHARPL
jgi:hypothetical protein